MAITNRKEQLILLVGDVLLFVFTLWLALTIRAFEPARFDVFYNHLEPFSLLFAVWVVAFFIAGLYDKHTLTFTHQLPDKILIAQTVNVVIAAVFFFAVPYFGIAPKTVLFIYLIVSFVLIILWRLYIFPILRLGKRSRAILLGSGREVEELEKEVNANHRYNMEFVLTLPFDESVNPNDLQKKVIERVGSGDVSAIVANLKNADLEPLLPLLYNLTFLNLSFRFIDVSQFYEDIFDRIPLSLVNHEWLLEHVTSARHWGYGIFKRLMDLVLALMLGVISLILYPFVWAAVKLEDGGPLFIIQERIGENNRPIKIAKFRSMTGNDDGKYGEKGVTELKVTRVGQFLRKTRIDELPQLWSVVKGDQSLIGPRPELPELVRHYAERVPFYNTRHLIKPGLSGWAQIHHDAHPHHSSDVTETKTKLSYDLYYIKNQSLLLDLHIALKTVRKLIVPSGV